MTIESFCSLIWNIPYSEVIEDISKQDYKQFEIPKKNGVRKINYLEESSPLHLLQKKLSKSFLSRQSLPMPAKGFKKGENYISYLEPHVGSVYYLRIDIADFFPSITEKTIKDELLNIIKAQTKEDRKKIVELICDITTLDGHLPQGASTSPMMSNIVMARIDQRILKYCQIFNITYTRYADDMLFSSTSFDFNKKWFLKKIKYILGSHRFKLNYSKFKKGYNELSLNGYVISKNGIRLSRNRLSDIRHILSFAKNHYTLSNTDCNKFLEEVNKLNLKHRDLTLYPYRTLFQFIQYICGYRAFLISFVNEHDKTSFQKNLQKLINRAEEIILLYL